MVVLLPLNILCDVDEYKCYKALELSSSAEIETLSFIQKLIHMSRTYFSLSFTTKTRFQTHKPEESIQYSA